MMERRLGQAAPQGPISGDMHNALIELAFLAEQLPAEARAVARLLFHGLFEAARRVEGLENSVLCGPAAHSQNFYAEGEA